jgi:hypothetical protein
MMSNGGPIYCIGDSHVDFFSGQNKVQPIWPEPSNDILPYFRTYRLGAVLAFSLCEYGTRQKGRELIYVLLDRDVPLPDREISPESKTLLCFGEIDCRAHLLRQAELQKRDIASVVEECVERYFSVILEIQQLGYEVLVWNAIPSSRHDHIPNKEFPAYGTCLERNRVTRLFNSYLSDLCSSSDAKFISIFDDLVDSQGLTRMEYYSDQVHLSQKAMPLALTKIEEMVGDLNAIKKGSLLKYKKSNLFHASIPRLFSYFRSIGRRY